METEAKSDDGFVSRAAFARVMNVSRTAVTQWANADRIVIGPDGRVDLEASKAKLAAAANTQGGKRTRGVATVAAGTGQGAGGSGDGHQGPPAGGRTLTDARMAQVDARAALDELELRERRGELIERTRFEKAIADGLGPILSQLGTLSSRIAAKVAGETDVRKIQDIIDDEVDKMRQDTADTLRAVGGGPITRQ